VQRGVTKPARIYPFGVALTFLVPRGVMLMTVEKQNLKNTRRPRRKARSTGLRDLVLDPAILDLVAVVAFGLALVICAARGDSTGMNFAGGGLGVSVLVAAVVRAKAI
jgi:hypothetical protein